MAEEIGNLLRKVAIEKFCLRKFSENQVVSNLLLEEKEDGNNRLSSI